MNIFLFYDVGRYMNSINCSFCKKSIKLRIENAYTSPSNCYSMSGFDKDGRCSFMYFHIECFKSIAGRYWAERLKHHE